MTSSFDEIIRRHCRPLEPIPTGEMPVSCDLAGVRAVLFDIYGTLLISASGDIDASREAAKGNALVASLAAVGAELRGDGEAGLEFLLDEIALDHERGRNDGIDYPEVDIIDVWRRTVARLNKKGLVDRKQGDSPDMSEDPSSLSDADLRRLALEYELRVNPVWPMPHATRCLEHLHRAGVMLGVISNAQFLTIELCRTLLRPESQGFEFDEGLQYYSYEHGRAKPSIALFHLAADALKRRNIEENNVLYVGNDILNDIMPAHAVGFRTALFAGDARSLRRREGDPRVAGVTPDMVVTDLLQIAVQ